MRVGVVAIGRPTFDLDWAGDRTEAALALLREQRLDVVGGVEPLLDPADVAPAVGALGQIDRLVLMQATFTDGRFVAAVSAATDAELTIWAFPEHRGGGRLRANSLCGLVLGAYTLAESGRHPRWLYADPLEAGCAERLASSLAAPARPLTPVGAPPDAAVIDPDDLRRAAEVVERLGRARVGVVGRPPPGFGPCQVHDRARVLGVETEPIEIEAVIQNVAVDRSVVTLPNMPAIADLDEAAVTTSVRLRNRLGDLAADRGWDALAVRCWPETFDVLGCAACAALAHLNEDGVPAGCEADALGAATMLVLGWLGESRPFLADLVDIETASNTAALWHCGVAPSDLAVAGSLRAGDHPNRGVPLVQELRLRPGTATVARFSQSRGTVRLVIGRVEIVDEPMPYVGSGGVIRFGRPADEVLRTIVDEGLEHHLALVAGDVTGALVAVASQLGLPVVHL